MIKHYLDYEGAEFLANKIKEKQDILQYEILPTPNENILGDVYQYIGNTTSTYTKGYFYECVEVTSATNPKTYTWEARTSKVDVDSALDPTSANPVENQVICEELDKKQDVMQYLTMPTADATTEGRIVQFIGTTGTYTKGGIYECQETSTDTYEWVLISAKGDTNTFNGTLEEWNALTTEEQNVYDIINITNDGDVLNLGVYLEKKTVMPVASEDVENKIYLYTGTTTQNFKKGVVYQCVSDGQTPATYSWVALIDFGTASIKNSTDRVSPNNTGLVESRAVYSAINTALSSIYTPRGDITCAELTSSLLISDNVGNVYEVSDSGTTTALFLQGAGHPITIGDNVGIINTGQGRILFNLMANAFDLTDYQKKDLANTIEGENTVEGALGALSNNKQAKNDLNLQTTSKTVVGAINEINSDLATKEHKSTIKTQTLAAGSTTVTFTQIPTTGDNLIDVYTSVAGLEYDSVDDTTAGQLTYTFEAQSAAVTVYLVIREVS